MKDANEPSLVATSMSIPCICWTATTQDAAASPSVAAKAAAVAAVRAGLGREGGDLCVPAYTSAAPLFRASSTSARPMPRLLPVTRTVLSAMLAMMMIPFLSPAVVWAGHPGLVWLGQVLQIGAALSGAG